MINNIKWDLLQPEDIEVRVGGKIKETNNVTMLLYQDSRCTARNLDKQFGPFGWQIDYKVVGEQVYGTLSIWDDTKQQWVSKSDTGDKSNISEDKGQSSDILKRCAVRWGFARELYTAPRIVIQDDGYGNSGCKVAEISYNENREINHLVIVNRFDKIVFTWNMHQPNNNHSTVIYDTKQLINETQTSEDLEWKPEGNFVAKVEMTKTLTPADELKNWYETTTHTPVVDKFYTYWHNRLTTNGWTGPFNLQTLIQKYCK